MKRLLERRELILTWIGVLASVVAGWFAVRGVALADVRDSILDAEVVMLITGTLFVLATYPLLGLRWRTVARGVGVMPRREAIIWVLISTMVNNVLPGRVGEFVRAHALHRSLGSGYPRALGVIVVDRMADLVLLACMLAATISLAADEAWVRWVAILSGALIVVVAAIIVAVTRGVGLSLLPGDHSRVGKLLRATAEGLGTLRNARQIAVAAGLTAAAWATVCVGALLIASSLGISLSIPEVVFVVAVASLGAAVPSAPGYIGTYHWLAAASLGLFGVAPEAAAAFAVVFHAAWFLPTIAVGLLLLAHQGISLSSLKGVARRIRPTEERPRVPSRVGRT